MTEESRVCRHCGASIGGAPSLRAGEEFCCEGCFLKSRRSDAGDAVEAEHDALAEALAAALDLREQETGLHSKRVACHTLVLARRFTNDRETLRQIYWGALLHDIGKIGIPDAILLKPGPLTEAEQVVMRTHPEKGHAILSDIAFLKDAAQIVLSHEERFAGTQFEPAAVEAFIAEERVLREMVAVKCAAESRDPEE